MAELLVECGTSSGTSNRFTRDQSIYMYLYTQTQNCVVSMVLRQTQPAIAAAVKGLPGNEKGFQHVPAT